MTDDQRKIELFRNMLISGVFVDDVAKNISSLHPDETYAISGDIDHHGICKEANFYPSESSFEDAMRYTNPTNYQWHFDESHRISCLVVEDTSVPEDIKMIDFYITKEMEGFDDVMQRFITTANAFLL